MYRRGKGGGVSGSRLHSKILREREREREKRRGNSSKIFKKFQVCGFWNEEKFQWKKIKREKHTW